MTDPTHRAELTQLLNAGAMDDLQDATGLAVTKLMLYEFNDVLAQTNPLVLRLQQIWESVRSDPSITIDNDEIEGAYGPSAGAFQKAIGKLN